MSHKVDTHMAATSASDISEIHSVPFSPKKEENAIMMALMIILEGN